MYTVEVGLPTYRETQLLLVPLELPRGTIRRGNKLFPLILECFCLFSEGGTGLITR